MFLGRRPTPRWGPEPDRRALAASEGAQTSSDGKADFWLQPCPGGEGACLQAQLGRGRVPLFRTELLDAAQDTLARVCFVTGFVFVVSSGMQGNSQDGRSCALASTQTLNE